jgi:SAM-dependent methyltransferase
MTSTISSSDPTFIFPPDSLIYRVTGQTDRTVFYNSGWLSVNNIRAALQKVDRSLESYDTILDFGCGCGRILFWLRELARSHRIYGVDIDKDAIEWAKNHLPDIQLCVDQPLPPLDFPSSFFDLVYSHSIFTHINEEYQNAWLGELHRVTKPGATLVLSVNANHAFRELEKSWRKVGADPTPMRVHLQRHGILFIEDDEWKGGPFPDFYHSTFHAPWYVFRHWSSYFKIHAYLERGALDYQDFVVLEREI